MWLSLKMPTQALTPRRCRLWLWVIQPCFSTLTEVPGHLDLPLRDTTSLTEQALVLSSLQPSAPDVDVCFLGGAPAAPSSVSLLLDRMAPSWNTRENLIIFLASHANTHTHTLTGKHTLEWSQSGWMKMVPAARDAPGLTSSGSCQPSDCEKFCPQTNRRGNTELLQRL